MSDTLSANCAHEAIQSWRFVDGQPAEFWSCADCKLKFVPIDGLLTAEREVERLRTLLKECADDLETEIEARRSGELPRRIERDLEPVRKARAALKETK
jgi:hypothetical protein